MYKSPTNPVEMPLADQARFMTQTPAPQDVLPVIKNSTAGVVCPRCARRSIDESFCEHCQFELPPPTIEMAAFATLHSSMWSLASFGINWPEDPSPSFDVVLGKSRFRVRAIRPELWPVLAPDVRIRQATSLQALPPVHLMEVGGGALVLAEAWPPNTVGVVRSAAPTSDDLLVDTLDWCRQVQTAMTELHASGHVWLEFDSAAVEIQDDRLRITNLDWRLFPFGQCPHQLARVSPVYSAPEVCQFRDEFIGPRTDVFHLALSAYYRLAGRDSEGFSGRGLESFGFDLPPLRVFRSDLPTGFWPVLRRALSINPNQRPASPGEFVQQLERVFERENVRRLPVRELDERVQTSTSLFQRAIRLMKREPILELRNESLRPIAFDIGSLTVAGRAKSALGAINQDCAVVLHEPVLDREIVLMIVADGVTHARVGTGDRASGVACKVLVDSIREQIRSCSAGAEPFWPGVLDQACQLASQAVVDDALSIPDRPARARDSDMMSTTALIGVLDARDLYLANVGDSRAYLVGNGIAEQLTVDGDVASSQLMSGIPPEQVQELGSAGKALRFCLGACRETDDGQIVADRERAGPTIGHWRIEPGDTFVLCSDGLVEERVFLEPEDLVRIIETHLELSSQGLAEELVAAADARQRLPSETEPNGYGDNITCVVLRITEGLMPIEATSRKV